MKAFIEKMWKKLTSKEVILYIVFGVLTTLVNYAVFWVMNTALQDRFHAVSNVVAWIAAVLFAYVTNKLFVFESKSWKPALVVKEVIGFAAGRLLTLGLETVGLILLSDVLGMNAMIAKILLSVIVVILNYVFSKLWVFRKRSGEEKKDENA